jgi:hypothetical protein
MRTRREVDRTNGAKFDVPAAACALQSVSRDH